MLFLCTVSPFSGSSEKVDQRPNRVGSIGTSVENATILVAVLQPSRGWQFDKSLIINAYLFNRPRSKPPGWRTERLVHKLSVENQVFS